MSTGVKVLIVVGNVLALLVGLPVVMGISVHNSLVRQENKIEAVDKDMQNVYASINQQIKAQGLTAEKYGDMVIEALGVAMSGRYGEDGSQAAFQWIQEQNPTIDPKIMEKLQTVIEAGYNRFEATQRSKIDAVRVYVDMLQVFPNNLFAGLMGFPRKDLEVLGRIVTSAQTKRDFEAGEMSQPDIFKQ